jgi:hypothetical protein
LWETTHGIKPFRNYKYTWWFTKEEVEEQWNQSGMYL